MVKHFIILSLTTVLLFPFSSQAQVDLKMLSPKDMEKDLTNLLENLEGHPDPYTKISENDFNNLVKDLEENISQEMDQIDFFKQLSQLVAAIGDGHSRLHMPRGWLKKMRTKNGAFPYEVFLSDEEELFVVKSYGDDKIPLGSQILSIDGMSVKSFIEALTPILSFETLPFRNDQISESFEMYLYLIFKKADQLKFKIGGAEDSEVVISTMPYKEWKAVYKDQREENERKVARGEPYDFTIVKPGIAKIDIFSFAVQDLDAYDFFLNKTFKTMRKEGVHSLIIDVRGNYGGWPKIASRLFHHIHDGHFKTMAKSKMKISKPYRDYYLDRFPAIGIQIEKFVFNQRQHYVDLEKVFKGTLNTYVEEDLFFNEMPIEENFEFDGDCYLLTDRKSYSASSCFASTFQCYNMGVIVGETTGGTKILRANAFYRVLAKSGFGISISSTLLHATCFDQENEAIVPHYEVVPTILDRVHKVDSQLNTALLLIRKVQKAKAEEAKK